MKYIMCEYDEAYTKKEVKEEYPIWCEKCTLECEYAKNRSTTLVAIPDNATNGDVFVAVWGYAPSQLRAQVDWWNAPYKRGE